MKEKKWTAESGLFLLFFVLAAFLRLLHLGQNPLNEAEAEVALRALSLARGETLVFDAQSGYVLLTGGLFYLLQSSAFLARLLPALAGSMLVGLPYLLREHIGRKAALLLTVFLAVDPGLVAASRQADSLILAMTFLLLALVFVGRKHAAWSGIFLGLALLSGPDLWTGVLAIAGAGLILYWRKQRNEEDLDLPGVDKLDGFAWKNSLIWLAATLVLVGTLFFTTPGGLGGLAASLPEWFTGWTQAAPVSLQRIMIALFVYEVLGLVFGIWGMVSISSIRDGSDVDRFLRNWALLALVLVLLYPARQEIDLVWALIPLLGLVARVIVRWLESEPEPFWIAVGLAAAVVVLSILVWMNLVSFTNTTLVPMDMQLRYFRLGATVLVIAVLVLLVGWGWSASAAKSGFAWGLAAALLLYSLSAAWHASGMGPHPEAEVWLTGPYAADADLIIKTVEDLSLQQTGERTRGEVTVLGVESSSLAWLLRDMENARFVDTIPAGSQPVLLITPAQEELELSASYTGQDFVLNQVPAWSWMLRPEWLSWISYREAVVQENQVILWARSDTFPMWTEASAVEDQE